VAHTCHSSYLGGGDQEDQGLRPVQVKSSRDPISSNKKLGTVVMVVCACHPRYEGGVNRIW
jgi:hypothetical protein